jgi:hypothetical protein
MGASQVKIPKNPIHVPKWVPISMGTAFTFFSGCDIRHLIYGFGGVDLSMGIEEIKEAAKCA